MGAFITAVDNNPTFNVHDIKKIIEEITHRHTPPLHVMISLAPETIRDVTNNAPPPLHLRQLDLEYLFLPRIDFATR
jgi:hypothetical protein